MYLDPGFGGMLVQIIIAIVAMGGALLYAFRRKISAVLKRKKNGEEENINTEAPVSTDDVVDTLADDTSLGEDV